MHRPRQRNTRSQNKSIKEGERSEEFDANKSVGRQRDTDTRWIKKNNHSYYGYKNHVKVDLKSKLIIKSEATSAEVHDIQVFKQLLDEKDEAVLTNSTYYSKENEDYVLGCCQCTGATHAQSQPNNPKRNPNIHLKN